ncbi:MAG: twin-arginine translocation signal domain-containing protein, partial [Planctomycetota bacterium]
MSTAKHSGSEVNAAAKDQSSRRALLKRGALAGVAAVGGLLSSQRAEGAEDEFYRAKKGRINQSVVSWCFNPMKVETLARAAVKMGIKSVELVGPKNWPLLKKLGLACAITPTHGFRTGFAHKEEQPACIDILRKRIDETAEAGFTSVITFSGFRKGLSDEEAIDNMVSGFK